MIFFRARNHLEHLRGLTQIFGGMKNFDALFKLEAARELGAVFFEAV